MIPRKPFNVAPTLAVAVLVAISGCTKDTTGLPLAPFDSDPTVEIGAGGIDFLAFSGTNQAGGTGLDVDDTGGRDGGPALVVTVPDPTDPAGSFAGGVLASPAPRDLTGYNALTFWARASRGVTLDVVGFGDDNTGTSMFPATTNALALTTSWRKYIVPIPLSSKLEEERGLFTIADGADGGTGYDIWLDDIMFENLPSVTDPRPSIDAQTISATVGGAGAITGTQVVFDVGGGSSAAVAGLTASPSLLPDVTVIAAPAYFTFSSSDETVATVAADGTIQVVGEGTAEITAMLGSTPAAGTVTVTGGAEIVPTAAAPTPTFAQSEVVSLFSNAYTNVTVDTWSAVWDDADVADVQVAGDDVKKYTNLSFAGIEFTSAPVDASGMNTFHMDIWTADPTAAPAVFKIKLVDFGPDGTFDGGDDTEHELTFTDATTPPLVSGQWVSFDIPLADFTGMTGTGAIAQMIISGDPNTVFVDNVFFHNQGGGGGGGGGGSTPTVAAPTPTQAPGDVISMFSNAYTDVTVDTWSATWDNADVADVQVAGDDTKLYTNLSFAGIEATSSPIDASSMTHFRMDIWTPDAPGAFKIKLVDAGANGTIDGGGDDTEFELTFDASTTPAIATGQWISFDIPLTDFTGMGTGAIAQMIISGDPNTVYVDNVYFYDSAGGGGGGSDPATAAPTPTEAAGDVISLFSNAYTDVTVDTWSATWDNADVEDVQIAGDDTKKYTNLSFAGIEFTSAPIDASGMTHFSMDIWTPDAPGAFKIKLVDAGANGTVDGGGDDTEFELTFDASTTPAIAMGQWISFDIPLADFTGMGTGAIAQMIISGDPNTVFVDNVYFFTTGGGSGSEPAAAAPTPTEAAGDVISLFSNAYTNVTVDTWSAGWDNADVEDVQIAGDDTKKYTNLSFAGIEFTSAPIDASGMTHFSMDIWTPDAPGAFKIKLVDAGANGTVDGGGDDTEFELTFDASTTPAIAMGQWISFDIPLADFTGMGTGAIAQMIISGDPNTVFVDNVYFYTTGGGGGGGGSGVIDFEPGGLGASWNWGVFENVDNPALQFVANPNASGANTSATVAMFTARQAGQPYAGTITSDAPTFTLDATNAIVKIMVYKSVVSDVGIKFENGAGGSTGEIKVANTLTDQWEELTFDFSGVIGDPNNTDITGLIVFPDFQGGRTSDNVVYFDNISFNATGGGGGGGGSEPAAAAPTPTEAAGDVISLFSNAYTNVTVDTWSAGWDNADVADVQVAGDDNKLYTNLSFAGIEFTSAPIDASGMTHFSMDIWTPDAPGAFKIKLVDAGADGVVGTGGDDTEFELTFDAASTPAIAMGQWISFDIPLTDFTGMGTGALAQMIISGDPNTVYVDNVYFYTTGGGGGSTPTAAAPTPTEAAGDVISLFSNAYTNVTVDTWSAGWDNADVADVQVAGDDNKLYTNLSFAGIEFTSAPIDASGMTHFSMDIWTPDAPGAFKIKLVDAGADGVVGTGGDDTEFELTFDAASTPAITMGQWISFDIPLTDFTGMGTGALAQMIISGDPNTVYVDNVYFYTTGGGGGGGGGSGAIDFEPGGLGASWTWNVFENVDNPALQFVANPNASGANTSATVAMFTARQTGQPFAGTITLDSPTFTLDASNAIVRIMVYKSVISDVGIKFENATFGSTGEIKVANTQVNQWEELTFDFSGVIGDPNNTDITGLIVFPDFQSGRTSDNVVYFDNISFSNQ